MTASKYNVLKFSGFYFIIRIETFIGNKYIYDEGSRL